MKKIIICTLCPNGCEIEAEYTCRDDLTLYGNLCDRGSVYAANECFDPHRTFTGNVAITGSCRRRLPVRSTRPIPKDRMLECAQMLRKVQMEAPVETGAKVIENIFDLGADIVAAMSIWRDK